MTKAPAMTSHQLIPLSFSKSIPNRRRAATILAGDVGGTKTNMALYRSDADGLTELRSARYASQEYDSLSDIVKQFAGDEKPDRICIAVAGPVMDGKVKLTNLSWQLDSTQISKSLKIPVVFINDLEANGYGLAGLQTNELVPLHTVAAERTGGNIAIISPGTGLGEAGLYFDGKHYHPFAAEGGHGDFAPRTEQDVALWRFLQQRHGHVSWERVVSGPGIATIFEFLTSIEKKSIPAWLSEELREGDPAAVISNAAQHQQEPVCSETLQLFSHYLAVEAANLVIKLKATGGCYLGGGIAPKVLPVIQDSGWLSHFTDMGRMQPLLEQVPVYVILNGKTALVGAAWYGAYNM